jgi:hypothetical protein
MPTRRNLSVCGSLTRFARRQKGLWFPLGKKRLIVDLLDVDHATLVNKARAVGLTVSNFVRQACGLPLEHQGKKRAETEPKKRTATKRASKRKKKDQGAIGTE